MDPKHDSRDEDLSVAFAAKCDEARKALRKRMSEHGFSETAGWRVYEFTRQVEGRTELVMRPMHRELTAPAELECACIIDEPGSRTWSECRDDEEK